jgi:radical SAM superfamily enzyme YgiQ (UPF0313 family)
MPEQPVVLINPPSPFLINQKSFSPLGILYLAAELEKNNLPVRVVDLADSENDMEAALRSYLDAELFGISATTPQYPYARAIKDAIKRAHPEAKVVLGGVHGTDLTEKCLNDGFDIVVKGEGEKAIVKIVHDFATHSLDYRTLQLPYEKDMDSLPLPARHLIPLKEYGYDIDGVPGASVITSRGCPYHCVFCSKGVWEQGVRLHSVEYVVRELVSILQNYTISHFLFLDDAINIDRNRLVRLCTAIKPLGIKWRCYARADFHAKGMLIAMKEAGCVEIGVGIESGSQKILDIVGKGSTVEKNTSFVKECKSVGVAVNVFVMIGLPGETHETVEATKKWIGDAMPDKFGFNIFMPYAGTPVWRNLEKYDLCIADIPEEHSWVKGRSGQHHCYVSTNELSSSEILRLFNELFDYYTQLLHWRPGVGRVKQTVPGNTVC